ncbi:MAG: DUF2865 domain-containing protein [Pseudomonadota bacterium]
MRQNLRSLEAKAGGGQGGNQSLAARLRRDYARYQCNRRNRIREVRSVPQRSVPNTRTEARTTQKRVNPVIKTVPQAPAQMGYRTVCVRMCDGYFFPVSFSTTKSRFRKDANACQKLSGNAETELFYFKLPDETLENARSLSGKRYASMDNAFKFKRQFVNGCSFHGTDEKLIELLRQQEAKRIEHPESLPTVRLASLSPGSKTVNPLDAISADQITPGSEADRKRMTEELLAALPEAKTGFRNVFETPAVTPASLASTYFLRHDTFPPVPFARPNPDETDEDRRERLAELDRLAEEEAALIGKGKYVVSHTDYPPTPISRPGADTVAATVEPRELAESKATLDSTLIDPIVTSSVRYVVRGDDFPPVPFKRPAPSDEIQLSSVQ